MKKSLLKLILCLIFVTGTNFTVIGLATPAAEQETSPNTENNTNLKPDLPKLDVPVPKKPIESHPLKGSVQHSEILNQQQGQTSKSQENDSLNGLIGKTGNKNNKKQFRLRQQQLNSRLSQNENSGLGIIGLKFASFFGRAPVIYQVFPETPAAEAGMKPRDKIIAVDGIPTIGLSKDEVYYMIVGQPGTEVTISFMHGNNFEIRKLMRLDVNKIMDPRVRSDYLGM